MARRSNMRSLFAAIRRRRGWALASATIAVAATAWIATGTEPVYRATLPMRLEGRTIAADTTGTAVLDLAVEEVGARRRRVLARTGSAHVEVAVTGVVVETTTGAAPRMSIAFDAYGYGSDVRSAERTVSAFGDALASDAAEPAAPPVTPREVDSARGAVTAAANEVRRLREELERFERDNAAGLPELAAASRDAIDLAIREREALGQQIESLEARRVELDRGLHEIERDASAGGSSRDLPTAADFEALQVRWAVVRGRYGAEHPEARALAAEVARMRAAGQDAFDAVAGELREARDDLAGLERVLPIDHPDVVRQAHRVSALESRAAQARLPNLTTGDRDYIESLARERRNVDPRLADLRDAKAPLDQRIAEHEAIAAQAPVLARRHESLRHELSAAEAKHRDAAEQYAALQSAVDAARDRRRGDLSLASGPSVRQLPASRRAVVAGAGIAIGLVLVLLVVTIVERLDRRIVGPDSIASLQGSAPLAEIPVLA